MSLPKSVICKFAPIVRLHPNETYFPMDPMDFLRASRFRHHKSWAKDEGYNKVKHKWIGANTDSAAYYDVPVTFINKYKAWVNGENRRPRDSNSGSKWNVYLQPKGKPKGNRNPNGAVPVFYYSHRMDTSKIPAALRKQFNIKVEVYDRIQYWWFHGYNDGPAGAGIGNHQGDWEHVTCKVKNGNLVKVAFAQHDTRRSVAASNLQRKGSRFIVYSALGSHGSYEKSGQFTLLWTLRVKDKAKAGGYEWDTSLSLRALTSQLWRDYAGAWGEVGQLADTTGPLGPWYKRHKD